MKGRELLRGIVEGIKADTARCELILPLLSEQQRLLARHDSEALAGLAAQLDPHLEALASSAATRARAFRGLGLAPSTQGVTALLAKLPAPMAQSLEKMWRQLELGLTQCQALNERNGQLLAHQRTALAELTGRPLNQYGALR